jgi:serine/threonine-protein kinase RsbW
VDEAIDLTVPTLAELMALVRFTAATLASRAQFSMEEIDDLRLAADELCLSVTGRSRTGPMQLHFTREHDTIEISCTVDAPVVATTDEDDAEHEWSLRILDALVAEHGQESAGGQTRAWLRKRRTRTEV